MLTHIVFDERQLQLRKRFDKQDMHQSMLDKPKIKESSNVQMQVQSVLNSFLFLLRRNKNKSFLSKRLFFLSESKFINVVTLYERSIRRKKMIDSWMFFRQHTSDRKINVNENKHFSRYFFFSPNVPACFCYKRQTRNGLTLLICINEEYWIL